MAHWQDRFLGIGELPPELSIFEIEFFQFSAPDVVAVRKEFRPKYRIAVALQLGFMRLTGARLNAFNVVPRKLLNLVGEQVGENAPSIASLRSMYRRGNTRRDHQAWVMQWLNIKVHTKRQERMLFAALREASKATGSIDRLIATARQWLFDKSLLVPATVAMRTQTTVAEESSKSIPKDRLPHSAGRCGHRASRRRFSSAEQRATMWHALHSDCATRHDCLTGRCARVSYGGTRCNFGVESHTFGDA
jgi:hypothetical protein